VNRLAWIGNNRQVWIGENSGRTGMLTAPVSAGLGAWGTPGRAPLVWSWPTWSPDARWIAAFGVESSDDRAGPVRVDAISIDGVQQEQWYEAPNVSPIYMQWRPDGESISVLVQRQNELALGVVARRALGRMRQVEAGVPLFFNWTPGGERLLLHVGDRTGGQARLILRDPFGPDEDVPFAQTPGSFCAPVFAGDRAIYAVSGEDESVVVASTPSGGDSLILGRASGLLALVPAPRGAPFLAMSHAAKGEGTPYRGIDLVDVRDGFTRTLTKLDCFAFFWAPTGEWILAAQVVADENCLRWWRVSLDGSDPVDLGTFWPTRDVLFYLHFFDQYTGSHPLVSADGRHLTWAGYPAGGGHADLSVPSRVFVKDTVRPDAPAEEWGEGVFSVWSPAERSEAAAPVSH
jgi:hypothetical protein